MMARLRVVANDGQHQRMKAMIANYGQPQKLVVILARNGAKFKYKLMGVMVYF